MEGEVHRQEFSPANAGDVNEVLTTPHEFGDDRELARFVPQRFCSGDCVVNRDFSSLDPGVIARKDYASLVGFFLEVKPDTEKSFRLPTAISIRGARRYRDRETAPSGEISPGGGSDRVLIKGKRT